MQNKAVSALQERARFLASLHSDIEIIGFGIQSDEFTDFICDQNGDIITYRVRGTVGSYMITER